MRDTGIGISSELLPHVFEIFTQAERSADRHQGGLGLGLSLVKNLVSLQGGQVGARSAGLGQGSEFTITFSLLPAIDVPSQPTLVGKHGKPEPRSKVMVVDDNTDAAQTLATLLEMEGHTVAVASTAEEALNSIAHDVPQVFILDIGLTGMDGFALARRLRAAPATAGATLIAITDYGQLEDRARSSDAGFDHHFEKPMEPRLLLDLLDAERSTVDT